MNLKVLELRSWAVHQTCYGSSVGFGVSNGLRIVGFIRQHLNLEPRDEIESKFHGIGLVVVREGKALTHPFLDLRLPSQIGGILGN